MEACKMSLISQEQLLRVLLGFNPWWTTGEVPREFTKPVKRLAFFEAKKLFLHPKIRREVILSGPRRVGKTTILYQMIEELLNDVSGKQVMYVSFDHPYLKLSEIGEILKVFELNIAAKDRVLYLFLDEIQYADDWDRWLKWLYDQRPDIRIMATGSATPILKEKMSESGVGRWTEVRVPTLSFYEYVDLLGVQKPALPDCIKPTKLSATQPENLREIMLALTPLQKHFHDYLLTGGFPETVGLDEIPLIQKIIREDVVDKVLKRDIVALFQVRNVVDLEKLFLFLCMESGNIISQDTLSKEIGVSRQTIGNYLELLEQSNLIYLSHPVETTGKKVLKTRPKIYLADAAIRNAVLMYGREVLLDPDQMGLIVETAVYKHLHTFYYGERPKMGYFRDSKTQKEIDVVVNFPIGKILVEIKYRENANLAQDEAIVLQADDAQSAAAIVITKNAGDYGPLPFKTQTPITKIPAFAFLYLLGHTERMRNETG
jgi:uncharacterized protein